MKVKNIFYFCFVLTIVLTYVVITAGGLVRVTGAGLGCPDWPKCFGMWHPPFDVNQIPPGIDPSLFNFRLAWTEYINRLVGVLVGFAILGTFILGVRQYCEKWKSALITVVAGTLVLAGILIAYVVQVYAMIPVLLVLALALTFLELYYLLKYGHRHIIVPIFVTLILVGLQGYVGGQVVQSELNSIAISNHLIIAWLMTLCLIYAWVQIIKSKNEQSPRADFQSSKKYTWLARLSLMFVIIQILTGAGVRANLENLIRIHPSIDVFLLIDKMPFILEWHKILGFIVLVACIYLAYSTMKIYKSGSLPYGIGILLIVLLLTQTLSGTLLVQFDFAALFQLMHVACGSLTLGAVFFLVLVDKTWR